MEHQTLQGTFVVGAIASVVAAVLAVVMLVRWLRDRREGRPSWLACLAFVGAVGIVGLSTAWLVHERAEKCGPTIARTLCKAPTEWLGSL
jgi:uncharacterized membrane protein YhaH (DUF805 family)